MLKSEETIVKSNSIGHARQGKMVKGMNRLQTRSQLGLFDTMGFSIRNSGCVDSNKK